MFYVSPAVCFGRCCSMLLLFGFISSLCINNNVGTGWFGISRINSEMFNALHIIKHVQIHIADRDTEGSSRCTIYYNSSNEGVRILAIRMKPVTIAAQRF